MAYTPAPSKSPFGFPQVHSDITTSRITNGGEVFNIKVAISAENADADILYTVPANLTLLVLPFVLWEVATAWTGGSSSAIGLSSSATGFTTKGDVHGGASGDVLATLTAGLKRGTAGAKIATPGVVLPAGSTIRFDRITSAFTAGAGNVIIPVMTL